MAYLGRLTMSTLKEEFSSRKNKTVSGPELTPAAVMLIIYQIDGQDYVLFNKRSNEVKYHKGEVAFPGGGVTSQDGNLLDTALRELREEMGVSPKDVDLVGRLDDVTTRTSFVVTPFVGTITYPYLFTPSPLEVDEVIEIPLSDLLDPSLLREEVHWVDGSCNKSYSYVWKGNIIHGATARILDQYLQLIRNIYDRENQE